MDREKVSTPRLVLRQAAFSHLWFLKTRQLCKRTLCSLLYVLPYLLGCLACHRLQKADAIGAATSSADQRRKLMDAFRRDEASKTQNSKDPRIVPQPCLPTLSRPLAIVLRQPKASRDLFVLLRDDSSRTSGKQTSLGDCTRNCLMVLACCLILTCGLCRPCATALFYR